MISTTYCNVNTFYRETLGTLGWFQQFLRPMTAILDFRIFIRLLFDHSLHPYKGSSGHYDIQ